MPVVPVLADSHTFTVKIIVNRRNRIRSRAIHFWKAKNLNYKHVIQF